MKKLLLGLCAVLVAASSYAQWGPTNATYLQGRLICNTAPSDSKVLKWSATNSCWEPGTDTGGLAAGDNVAWTGDHSFALGVTIGSAYQVDWGSTGVTTPDVGLKRTNAGVLAVSDASTGYGTMSAIGLNLGAYTAIGDGKLSMTSVLNDGTGNEVAATIGYTVNKASSGNDTGLKIAIVDTSSPGVTRMLDLVRGTDSVGFDVTSTGNGNLLLLNESGFNPYFFEMGYGKLQVDYRGGLYWPSTYTASDTADTGVERSAAGVVKLTDGSTGYGVLDVVRVRPEPLASGSGASASTLNLHGQSAGAGTKSGTGGNVATYPGIGNRWFTVVDYTNLSGAVVTVSYNDNVATTLTEGVNWTAATSNDATATSLASAIDGLSGMSASASSGRVSISPDAGTRNIALTKTASDSYMTLAQTANGGTVVNSYMEAPTGNEVAMTISATTNKATSGNDTALLISQTDTSSPGTSYLINSTVGGQQVAYLSHAGSDTSTFGLVGSTASTAYAYHDVAYSGFRVNESSGYRVIDLGSNLDGIANTSVLGFENGGHIKWSADDQSNGTKDVGLARSAAGILKVTGGGNYYNPTTLGTLKTSNLTITGLSTPSTPVITQGGTGGATSYGYKVVARLADGTTTAASAEGTTATGNATLDGTNYNIITWSAVTDAWTYDVYRTSGGATQGKIITGTSTTVSPQNDTGLAASGAAPSTNTTAVIDGPAFDVANDGKTTITQTTASTNLDLVGPASGNHYWFQAHQGGDLVSYLARDGSSQFIFALNSRESSDGGLFTIYPGNHSSNPRGIFMPSYNRIWWCSGNDCYATGSPDTGISRATTAVVKVTDGTTGGGTISAAGLNLGAYTAIVDGKISTTTDLNDNTGNEAAVTINYTTNKGSSGDDVAIKLAMTDTASPGNSRFLEAYRGANLESGITAGDDPAFWVKTFAAAGTSTIQVQHTTGNDWLLMGANGSASSNGLLAGDVFLRYAANDHRGLVILGEQPGSYSYGVTTQHAVRLGELGGSNTMDAGVRRSAANTVQVFDGNVSSPTAATLAANAVTLDTNTFDYADTVTLTDGSSSDFIDIAIADGDMMGGEISYTITGTDATDFQAISGTASFAAVRKAGAPSTYVCDIDEHLGTDSTAATSGTLSDSFSCAGASDKITLSVTATSSLGSPAATVTMRYQIHLHSTKAITKK